MSQSVLTERRPPLPLSLSALPVELILCTRSNSVCHFMHCLAENSTIKPFLLRNVFLSCQRCHVHIQVTSPMTGNHFRLFSKEYLTNLHKFRIAWQTVIIAKHSVANNTRFYGERFKLNHVQNFVCCFSGPSCT